MPVTDELDAPAVVPVPKGNKKGKPRLDHQIISSFHTGPDRAHSYYEKGSFEIFTRKTEVERDREETSKANFT